MPRILHRIKIPILGIEFPNVELPEFPPKPPKLDERGAEVLRHAIADDLADLIPVAGDFVSDTSYAEIRGRMSPEEYEQFTQENKWLPSSLAALKIFAERE